MENFFFIDDDVDYNKYFEYRGLYFRATDFENLKCEVVTQEDVPTEILEYATTVIDTPDALELPANVFYKGVEYLVAGIGNNAFSTYTDLQEVVIPETMEYIGNEAFAQCPLTKVEVKAIIPPVAQEDSFDEDVYASAELIVPDESKNEYRVAAVWKNFAISSSLATSITLDLNEKSARVGDEFGLTANVMPEDTADKSVAWSSSDENIATVDTNGWVKVVGEGICIITATTTDGSNLSAECIINAVSVSVDEVFIDNYNVDVYSLTGTLIKKNADANDIKHFAPGIYIIKTCTVTRKVVIK